MNIEKQKIALGVADYIDYLNLFLKPTEYVQVVGEISSIKQHPTGVYMTLKDQAEDAALDCYINPYVFKKIRAPLEEGVLVRLTGVAGLFKRRGSLRFKVEDIELEGEGGLKKAYELLKKKLEAEGLFDRKRDLPETIHRIALVTSANGAVIHDFEQNLNKQGLLVSVYDVRVEGRNAAQSIVKALDRISGKNEEYDVCVIIRGGGSFEDLFTFSLEEVVRAIYKCPVPVLAGIGHEMDVPLACLVSDFYGSTPTAVAVKINQINNNLLTKAVKLQEFILESFDRSLYRYKNNLIGNLNRIVQFEKNFNAYLSEFSIKYIKWMSTIELLLNEKRNKLLVFESMIKLNNPMNVLKRGFALVTDSNGKVVASSMLLSNNQEVNVKFRDGEARAKIEHIKKQHEEN